MAFSEPVFCTKGLLVVTGARESKKANPFTTYRTKQCHLIILPLKNELVSSEKQRNYVGIGFFLDMVDRREDVRANDRKYTTNQDDRETGGSAGCICGNDIAI